MSKFELKETPKGCWHFVLKADNGETIAQSETYTSKAAAEKGIESVRASAPDAAIVYEQAEVPEVDPDYEEDRGNMPTPFVVDEGKE